VDSWGAGDCQVIASPSGVIGIELRPQDEISVYSAAGSIIEFEKN
jgi:hypothetical protein